MEGVMAPELDVHAEGPCRSLGHPPSGAPMSVRPRVAVVLLSLLPAALFAQASRHVPTVDDLLELRAASGPQISPDGKWVAYLVSQTDWQHDEFVSQLWIVSADGGEARQLTRGERSASPARWSPDSKW